MACGCAHKHAAASSMNCIPKPVIAMCIRWTATKGKTDSHSYHICRLLRNLIKWLWKSILFPTFIPFTSFPIYVCSMCVATKNVLHILIKRLWLYSSKLLEYYFYPPFFSQSVPLCHSAMKTVLIITTTKIPFASVFFYCYIRLQWTLLRCWSGSLNTLFDVNHFQFPSWWVYVCTTRSHVRKQLNRYFWCNDCAV